VVHYYKYLSENGNIYNLLADEKETGNTSMAEEESMGIIKKELEKPEKDQDKALLLKALRATFKPRRKFIQETEDGNIKAVVQKYPLLKVTNFVSSFYLIFVFNNGGHAFLSSNKKFHCGEYIYFFYIQGYKLLLVLNVFLLFIYFSNILY